MAIWVIVEEPIPLWTQLDVNKATQAFFSLILTERGSSMTPSTYFSINTGLAKYQQPDFGRSSCLRLCVVICFSEPLKSVIFAPYWHGRRNDNHVRLLFTYRRLSLVTLLICKERSTTSSPMIIARVSWNFKFLVHDVDNRSTLAVL